MSFLDNLLSGAQGEGHSLLNVAHDLLDKVGGVQGLADVLQQHGLGDKVQSWIGQGQNQPVSGQQLGDALQNAGHSNLLSEAAAKLGVQPNELMDKLSGLLPQAVDHLTPNGQASSQSGVDLEGLKNLAGKLFSKS